VGFKVIMARNEDVLSHERDNKIYISELNRRNQGEAKRLGFTGEWVEYSLETDVGNHLLKTGALNEAIERYEFDSLVVGIRWDENPARSTEVFVSKRESPAHYRVHLILSRKGTSGTTCSSMTCLCIQSTGRATGPLTERGTQRRCPMFLHGSRT